MPPLIASHAVIGRKFMNDRGEQSCINWREAMRFEGMYYSGVVARLGSDC